MLQNELKKKLDEISGLPNLFNQEYYCDSLCNTIMSADGSDIEGVMVAFTEDDKTNFKKNANLISVEDMSNENIEYVINSNFCLYIREHLNSERIRFYFFNNVDASFIREDLYCYLINDDTYSEFTLYFKGIPVNILCGFKYEDYTIDFSGLGGIEDNILSDRINLYEDDNLRFRDYYWLNKETDAYGEITKLDRWRSVGEVEEEGSIIEDVECYVFGIIGACAVVEYEDDIDSCIILNNGVGTVFKTADEAADFCNEMKAKNPKKNYAFIEGNHIFEP